MPNPWLAIPLADYEGHMKSAAVHQLEALSDLFAEALNRCRPSSVAVLGVAGGNGLDRIDPRITSRVVGLDFNRQYLDEAHLRHAKTCNLTLHCMDLASELVALDPVDLVHAALVFEHAGTGLCLDNAISLVGEGGALSVVLQLQDEASRSVGASAFPAMLSLKDHFSLVDPAWLQAELKTRGFQLFHEATHDVPVGKRLWLGIFRRV